MEAEGKADIEKQREAAEKLGQEVDELQVHITACALLSGHQTACLQTIPDQCQCLRCAAAMQREITEKEADIEQLGRERERQSGKEVKELSQSADELSKRCGQLHEFMQSLIIEH